MSRSAKFQQAVHKDKNTEVTGFKLPVGTAEITGLTGRFESVGLKSTEALQHFREIMVFLFSRLTREIC